MIYINRHRKDEEGKFINPSDSWFQNADEATEVAKLEKGDHDWDRGIYAHEKQVKPALEKLFHHKCAYCERELPGEWDVEHFRPKGRVAECQGHPGYYWLGYEWENLYPSCKLCNQRRKDKPLRSDLRELPAAGKLDQFPLLDESTRAMSDKDDIDQEQTLLIDPCYDDPEDYFGYNLKGEIFPLEDNPYGEKSIEVFNLNRRRLVRRRRKIINRVIHLQELVKEWEARGENEAARDFGGLLQDITVDESTYAGSARFVVNNSSTFFGDDS